MMFETKLSDVTEFIAAWNNHDKADKDNNVPLSEYNLRALTAGFGFTLKWYVTQEDFDKIAAEVKFEFNGDVKDKMLLALGEDRVEFEVDKYGILAQAKEDCAPIDNC